MCYFFEVKTSNNCFADNWYIQINQETKFYILQCSQYPSPVKNDDFISSEDYWQDIFVRFGIAALIGTTQFTTYIKDCINCLTWQSGDSPLVQASDGSWHKGGNNALWQLREWVWASVMLYITRRTKSGEYMIMIWKELKEQKCKII